jgi:hypothetical protein
VNAPPLRITAADLRLPAAAAAVLVFGTSAGDGFVAVVALLLAAGPVAGAAAGLAMAAAVARWGTADLGAVAGDQAVLGPAVAGGSLVAILSSALAALGLVLVARARATSVADWSPVVALGVGAAVLASGPAPADAGALAVRAVATVVGVAAAAGVAALVRRTPALDTHLSIGGVAATGVAVLLAVAA